MAIRPIEVIVLSWTTSQLSRVCLLLA